MKTAGVPIAISWACMCLLCCLRYVGPVSFSSMSAVINFQCLRLTQRRVNADITLLKLLPCRMGPHAASLE